MPKIISSNRIWLALAIWAMGLLLFIALGLWNMKDSQENTENRLLGEAGRIASQLAALVSLPTREPDEGIARAIVAGAMEDDHIYAVKIETRNGVKEGQRRNYLWEPILWDDEIAENCIQGMTPLKYDGKTVGSVEVWLSPRQINEEETQIFGHETTRFVILAFFWTAALLLLLWSFGELRRFRRQLAVKTVIAKKSQTDEQPVIFRLAEDKSSKGEGDATEDAIKNACDQVAGRIYQRKNPESWHVTAGLFRQTFSRAPELMSMLYSNSEFAGLCHLGRMLEKAAPCLGADKLFDAARHMQAALNDPESLQRASSVEECAKALEDVLASLGGSKKNYSEARSE